MQIDIQARRFSPTRSLRRYTERRIRFALTRFEERIQRISMWVADVNGPKGGRDKQCRLQVVLIGNTDIIIEDTQTNPYVAINRAIERAVRSLVRMRGRQRSRMQRTRAIAYESPVSA